MASEEEETGPAPLCAQIQSWSSTFCRRASASYMSSASHNSPLVVPSDQASTELSGVYHESSKVSDQKEKSIWIHTEAIDVATCLWWQRSSPQLVVHTTAPLGEEADQVQRLTSGRSLFALDIAVSFLDGSVLWCARRCN